MKPECRVIAVSIVALLASGQIRAHATAGAPARTPAHSRAAIPARASGYHAIGGVTATPRAATTPATAARAALFIGPGPRPAPSLPRSQRMTAMPAATPMARSYPFGAASGTALRPHMPVNASLGGPATFDARKLVRR
jgi:hypothetical protein